MREPCPTCGHTERSPELGCLTETEPGVWCACTCTDASTSADELEARLDPGHDEAVRPSPEGDTAEHTTTTRKPSAPRRDRPGPWTPHRLVMSHLPDLKPGEAATVSWTVVMNPDSGPAMGDPMVIRHGSDVAVQARVAPAPADDGRTIGHRILAFLADHDVPAGWTFEGLESWGVQMGRSGWRRITDLVQRDLVAVNPPTSKGGPRSYRITRGGLDVLAHLNATVGSQS